VYNQFECFLSIKVRRKVLEEPVKQVRQFIVYDHDLQEMYTVEIDITYAKPCGCFNILSSNPPLSTKLL
jgi:hypothetical protein